MKPFDQILEGSVHGWINRVVEAVGLKLRNSRLSMYGKEQVFGRVGGDSDLRDDCHCGMHVVRL